MLGHTDLKKDTLIELDGEPYRVVDYSHAAMGRGGAVARVKLKNLLTGSVTERTFRAADKIAPARIDRINLQYLYRDGANLVFMNPETYDQVSVPESTLGEQTKFIAEGSTVALLQYQNRIIGLDLPHNVPLKVTHTEAGARGDTATAALKPATVETGIEVMVPLFVKEGDMIKVDTRSGQYLERVK